LKCKLIIVFILGFIVVIIFRASKGTTLGHFLTGTIAYSKDEIGKKVVSLILLEKVTYFM
jgi:uncharacterized membrane-anchored protein